MTTTAQSRERTNNGLTVQSKTLAIETKKYKPHWCTLFVVMAQKQWVRRIKRL